MRIKKIHFSRYKTFRNFTVNFSDFDVLVGPNNAGKSTVLGAFRLLSEGLKKANSRKAQLVEGHEGQTWGYLLELDDIPVSLENVFYNYDESEPAKISFHLENGNRLILFFPSRGICLLIPEGAGAVNTPTIFKKNFPIEIKFVPVLGPVEHQEEIYQKEAARKALLTHRASRNFRNIWYHYPEGFDEFREMIKSTWPGMDIEPPEMITQSSTPTLAMFCPEERVPREIYWAGFGFQVWCQMLTFILQARGASVLVIDEPDIYLHSDLQRQLVSILKDLGIQVIIATHSIEIITEVEAESLLTIHKKRLHASRISNVKDLQAIYQLLGSNANPVLTQLAKTRRALFLEGKDFQILSLFARKLKLNSIANRSDFAVIPVEGFNPQKVKDFSKGIEITLGVPILKGVIFDRDYRSNAEIAQLTKELEAGCDFVSIHRRKEIENFLLSPTAINRAIQVASTKRFNPEEQKKLTLRSAEEILDEIANEYRMEILPKYLECKRHFVKRDARGLADAPIDTEALKEFEEEWQTLEGKLRLIPGKDALSKLNQFLQKEYNFSVTPNLIISSFTVADMDTELTRLIQNLKKFADKEPRA
ncbi:MAG: AAA family ATPase [Candidatus Pacebacteria bacterium]|nr:AAA family ATPase [Candidatus Paceibacterota bacterium]